MPGIWITTTVPDTGADFASGTGEIADTATTQSVAHGLGVTPETVLLTPRADEAVWVSARDATTFTAERAGTTDALAFDWLATGTEPGPEPEPPVTIEDAYASDGNLYIAHQGAPNLYPEHTMEAYAAIVADGATVLELDCFLLSDGAVGVMHDTTLDRTTTSTGNTADQTAASWASLVVDIGNSLGGEWAGTTQSAPLLSDVVDLYGNSVVLNIEAKNAGSGAAIVGILQSAGVATTAAMVASFIEAELADALTAGYPTMLLSSSALGSPGTVAGSGIEWVGYSTTAATSSSVPAAIAAGLKVAVYTVDRHWERDQFVGYGVEAFFSNDPIYVAEQHGPLTSDPFDEQTWSHGHLGSDHPDDRGQFFTPDLWGYDHDGSAEYWGALQGWACPVGGDPANDSYTVGLAIKFVSAVDSTRWASMFIGTSDREFDDAAATGVNGYHILFRKNGAIDIYRVTNGVGTSVASAAGTSIANGATATYTVAVTATGITVTRTDVSTVASTADATYRGGYFHLGCNRADVQFSDVTVTAA